MVNKTEGIFYDYRIYLPQKLRNKTNKKKQVPNITAILFCFQKNEKYENLLDFIEKMTKMTKSKNNEKTNEKN